MDKRNNLKRFEILRTYLINGSNNTLDHIIIRYANGNWIYISDKVNGNTLNYCYSYKNLDTSIYSSNNNGFIGGSNTVFNDCFAWDNEDNWWNHYSSQDCNSASVQYLHSAIGIMVIQMYLRVNMIWAYEDL